MTNRVYKIITSSGSRVVTPINDSELVYNYKKKENSINYDLELKTTLVFTNNRKNSNNDFDFFYSYESDISLRCENMTCEIYKICKGKEVLEFTGIIPLKEGIWDLDRCRVELKLLTANDTYDCIDKNKTDTDLPIAFFCPISGAPSAGDPQPSFYLYDNVSGNTVFLAINQFTINSLVYNSNPWTQGSSGEIKYPYGLFATLCYGIIHRLLQNICGRDYDSEMLRSDFFDWNAKGDAPGYIPSVIPKLSNSLPINEYPVGGLPFNYALRYIFLPKTPGINYVTGQTNRLTHLLFMTKSNANDNTASAWEEDVDGNLIINTNKLTFEDIEQIWATMFNAYWFIDTDGCMRVEHISYFNSNAITYNSLSAENKKYNSANNKYTYIKTLLPKKEIFRFSANRDVLNGQAELLYTNKNNEIFYDSICVNNDEKNNEKNIDLLKVTTDIIALNSKNVTSVTEFYNNEGLMLFVCDFSATTNVHYYSPNYYGGQVDCNSLSELLLNSTDLTLYENGHLQWANLIRRYLRDNRPLSQGKNGNEIINFTSRTIKSKQQKNIILKYCCDNDKFTPNQAQIITELGTGDIDEAEYNTKTNLIKITALHD